MYHPLEIDKLHKHIDILRKQNEELQYTVKKLREELGRSGKTTWVENDVKKSVEQRKTTDVSYSFKRI